MKSFFLISYIALPLWGLQAQVHTTAASDTARSVMLQEVQITATQKSRQSNLYHFFSTNGAATTEDILARMPEINLIRRGSYGMEPVIRAYNTGQVQLLLDGMRIHGACTDKMDPASIYTEPANMSSIEVNTTGGSLMNGAAVGGTVNMKLAAVSCHEEPAFSGTLTSGYHSASHGLYESLSLNFANRKMAWKLTGTYRKHQNYTDGSGKEVAFSQFEKFNYSLHGMLLLKNEVYLKADIIADDGWNIGYAALPMDVGYAGARIAALSLLKEKGRNGWQQMEAKIYANRIAHYMDDSKRPDVLMHMDMPGKSFTTGMYVQAVKKYSNKQELMLRADAALTTLHASMTMYQPAQQPMYMLTWPDNRQVQSGFALQYLIRTDSVTQLQLNARADYNRFLVSSEMGKDQLAVFGYNGQGLQYFIPAVSVQLSTRLSRKIKATASAGINGRTPTASELFGFYLFNQFDGYDYIGNTMLKPETGYQAELSLSWTTRTLRVQTTGYVNRIQQYILGRYDAALSVMTSGAKGVKRYENINHALVAGAEASAVYYPNKNLQLIGTVKYTYGEDDNGNALPLIAPLRTVLSVKQDIAKLWLKAEAELAAAQNRVNTDAQEKNTAGFAVYHFRMGYSFDFAGKTLELNSGVENLLSALYREHTDWGNIARQGRNIYVQLRVKL